MEKITNPHIAQIVISKSGRDKNKTFLIIQIIDQEYVFVVDGELRKISKPKKKKIKHLKLTPKTAKPILEKIQNQQQLLDFDIKMFLQNHSTEVAANKSKTNKEKTACQKKM